MIYRHHRKRARIIQTTNMYFHSKIHLLPIPKVNISKEQYKTIDAYLHS